MYEELKDTHGDNVVCLLHGATFFSDRSAEFKVHIASHVRKSFVSLVAHLQPVHKAMGDEGFATGTDSSCG